jgi:hypothetical protein
MGCGSAGVEGVPTLLGEFGVVFDLAKWKSARTRGSEVELIKSINSISVNLAEASITKMEKSQSKCALIVALTYPHSHKTGVGPLNDCSTVANYLKRIGFVVYFLLNPNRESFLKWLAYFLNCPSNSTVIYYNGIGATIAAGPAPDDGRDEVISLIDGNVTEDQLATALSNSTKRPEAKLILISECSHSGYIWNLQSTAFCGFSIPKGVLSISVRRDGRGGDADMTSAGRDDAGLLTFYLFRYLNDFQGITMEELKKKVNYHLATYAQFLIETATSEELLHEAVLEEWVPPK